MRSYDYDLQADCSCSMVHEGASASDGKEDSVRQPMPTSGMPRSSLSYVPVLNS